LANFGPIFIFCTIDLKFGTLLFSTTLFQIFVFFSPSWLIFGQFLFFGQLTWNLVHFHFQLLVFRFSKKKLSILANFGPIFIFCSIDLNFCPLLFSTTLFQIFAFFSPILDWNVLHLNFWIAIFHLGTFFVSKHTFCLFCSLLWLTLLNSCHDNWLCGLVMTTDNWLWDILSCMMANHVGLSW
jgi:hypothetical protein